jgi:hypothetical protein
VRPALFVAALAAFFCTPAFADAVVTEPGQAICDTLLEFEELTIAISTEDDPAIVEMSNRGCHVPGPGLPIELVEAYSDQTVLLFGKLAEYTPLRLVPAHIERLARLAKVRWLDHEGKPSIGFTLLRVSRGVDDRTN